jgi:hypothetical protein
MKRVEGFWVQLSELAFLEAKLQKMSRNGSTRYS